MERIAQGLPGHRAAEWLRALSESLQTAADHAHGLALALPEAVTARPTGVGRALATYEIPIEGRDEWLAAARRHA